MPLLHNSTRLAVPPSLDQFFRDNQHYKETSNALRSQPVKIVRPQNLLYVSQREVAGTIPEDCVIKYIGTEDATTCHILILRHTGCGATVLSHFDGCETSQGVQTCLALIEKLCHGKQEGRLELHLAGGFCDDRQMSAKLSMEILSAFDKAEKDVHLVTACITDFNDIVKNGIHFPVIYGLVVNVETGEILQATFPDKGPDINIRSARTYTGGHDLHNIYDHTTKLLTIGPYTYHPLQDLEMWLRVPDKFILQYLSTSPEQEPPSFVQHVRETLTLMNEHPTPMQTLFAGNKGRTYEKEKDGTWSLIKSS